MRIDRKTNEWKKGLGLRSKCPDQVLWFCYRLDVTPFETLLSRHSHPCKRQSMGQSETPNGTLCDAFGQRPEYSISFGLRLLHANIGSPTLKPPVTTVPVDAYSTTRQSFIAREDFRGRRPEPHTLLGMSCQAPYVNQVLLSRAVVNTRKLCHVAAILALPRCSKYYCITA